MPYFRRRPWRRRSFSRAGRGRRRTFLRRPQGPRRWSYCNFHASLPFFEGQGVTDTVNQYMELANVDHIGGGAATGLMRGMQEFTRGIEVGGVTWQSYFCRSGAFEQGAIVHNECFEALVTDRVDTDGAPAAAVTFDFSRTNVPVSAITNVVPTLLEQAEDAPEKFHWSSYSLLGAGEFNDNVATTAPGRVQGGPRNLRVRAFIDQLHSFGILASYKNHAGSFVPAVWTVWGRLYYRVVF